MIIKTSTTFKQINYISTDPMKNSQHLLVEKPKIKTDHPIYSISLKRIIKEGKQWYKYDIVHIHDFSFIEKQKIQREIDKTIEIQNLILEFYQQNPIKHLNDPHV